MTEPLSILLVGDYPPDPTLGSSKVFYKLQEEFQARGHDCDIVFADEIKAPRLRQLGQVLAPWRAAAAIRRRLERKRYDVIDAASAEGLWIGALRKMDSRRVPVLIARSNGLEQLNYRRMLDDHSAGLIDKGWSRRIWYPLTRLSQVAVAARLADRLLLLNPDDRRYALDRRWKSEDRIDIVPHGVSDRFLNEAPAQGERGRGLLFCGSWDHMKGIAYLVRAFERLHARGRRVDLTVLGPGVDPAIVVAAFSPDVRRFVHVVPRAAEQQVIEAYRTHDALLWLSTYEGFGLVLLEAMSQGLAVITTPVGCVPTLVRNGENGLLVPKRDSEAAVAAVERLLEAPELRRTLGEAARRAVAGMTWGQTARMTLEVYARARETHAA
ncbi:MAG TPA: glycosyltransferase family 4 protein [Vicinamibacterales bacterium]